MRQIVSLCDPSLHRQPILPYPSLCNSRAMLHRSSDHDTVINNPLSFAFRAAFVHALRHDSAAIAAHNGRIDGIGI